MLISLAFSLAMRAWRVHPDPVQRRRCDASTSTCLPLRGRGSRPHRRILPTPYSGCRVGKFMRLRWSFTGACKVSASSTSSFMPFGVCATRPATITGFSAFTSSFASLGDRAGIALRGDRHGQFRNPQIGFLDRLFLQLPLATMATGPMGGVIAILYARTMDSAKCCSDAGASSHFV